MKWKTRWQRNDENGIEGQHAAPALSRWLQYAGSALIYEMIRWTIVEADSNQSKRIELDLWESLYGSD